MDGFDLTDRIALITGSSRGLGRTLAAGLADAGATVVLNGMHQAGLQVNALAPGYIHTEMTQNLVDDEAFNAWVLTRTRPAVGAAAPTSLARLSGWLQMAPTTSTAR